MLVQLVTASAAFHAPALSRTGLRAAPPLLQADAAFDYEAIVCSKLPFMSSGEAYTFLNQHSTKHMLKEADASAASNGGVNGAGARPRNGQGEGRWARRWLRIGRGGRSAWRQVVAAAGGAAAGGRGGR